MDFISFDFYQYIEHFQNFLIWISSSLGYCFFMTIARNPGRSGNGKKNDGILPDKGSSNVPDREKAAGIEANPSTDVSRGDIIKARSEKGDILTKQQFLANNSLYSAVKGTSFMPNSQSFSRRGVTVKTVNGVSVTNTNNISQRFLIDKPYQFDGTSASQIKGASSNEITTLTGYKKVLEPEVRNLLNQDYPNHVFPVTSKAIHHPRVAGAVNAQSTTYDGIHGYSPQDFYFSKYFGIIPNSRMITLIRYKYPVNDEGLYTKNGVAVELRRTGLVPISDTSTDSASTAFSIQPQPDSDGETSGTKAVHNPILGIAVTYFGGESSNTLNSILNSFALGFNWTTLTAPDSDGFSQSQYANTFGTAEDPTAGSTKTMTSDVDKIMTSLIDGTTKLVKGAFASATGNLLNGPLSFAQKIFKYISNLQTSASSYFQNIAFAQKNINGMVESNDSIRDAQYAFDPYSNGIFSNKSQYGVNYINEVKNRVPGGVESTRFALTFEYKVKSYGKIAPKAVFMDIMNNMLNLTSINSNFFGGANKNNSIDSSLKLDVKIKEAMLSDLTGQFMTYFIRNIERSIRAAVQFSASNISNFDKILESVVTAGASVIETAMASITSTNLGTADVTGPMNSALAGIRGVSSTIKANFNKAAYIALGFNPSDITGSGDLSNSLGISFLNFTNQTQAGGNNIDPTKKTEEYIRLFFNNDVDVFRQDSLDRQFINGNFPDPRSEDPFTSFSRHLIDKFILSEFKFNVKPSSIKPILTGQDVGEWRIVVGNPYNPIMKIGNLVLDSVSISTSEVLIDGDVPSEMKFTVNLSHGRPRDKRGFTNIFGFIATSDDGLVITEYDKTSASKNSQVDNSPVEGDYVEALRRSYFSPNDQVYLNLDQEDDSGFTKKVKYEDAIKTQPRMPTRLIGMDYLRRNLLDLSTTGGTVGSLGTVGEFIGNEIYGDKIDLIYKDQVLQYFKNSASINYSKNKAITDSYNRNNNLYSVAKAPNFNF